MFVVWDGDVTTEEWSDQFERIIADPVFPTEQLVLADPVPRVGRRVSRPM
jgi:hypothetical protein